MESESYRKIGRGGAGNFYSKQDIEEAARRAAEVCQNKPTSRYPRVPLPFIYTLQIARLISKALR